MKRLTPEQAEALKAIPLGDRKNRVAIARKLVGIDQTSLGRAAGGMTQSTISDIEAGREIYLSTAQRIADAIGASVDDLWPSSGIARGANGEALAS